MNTSFLPSAETLVRASKAEFVTCCGAPLTAPVLASRVRLQMLSAWLRLAKTIRRPETRKVLSPLMFQT